MTEITARTEELEETLKQIEKRLAEMPNNYRNSTTAKQLEKRAAQIRKQLSA
jgi:hypothetical protein